MPKKSLYIPDDIDRDIIAAGVGESYSGRVSFLLTAAREMASAAVPDDIRCAELGALADALTGHVPQYDQGLHQVLRGAWFRLYQAPPALAQKWEVDTRDLASRLESTSLPVQIGLYETARRMAAMKE